MDLVTIGTFATLSGLSVKALRLYDASGLLVPVHVDPQSGYRWYSREQVAGARTITLLRGLDMPLAAVQELMELLAPDAADALQRYWQTKEQRHDGQRQLLKFSSTASRTRGPRCTRSPSATLLPACWSASWST